MKRCQEAKVSGFQAFMFLLLFIAGGFSQTSSQLTASTGTAQHAPLLSGISATSLDQDSVSSGSDARYKMRVSIDEVRLTFHAMDKSGRPVDDLKAADVDLFDNEAGPGTIFALQRLKGRPLRVGFLVDTSGSVSGEIGRNRATAIAAAQALMQNKNDQGLVIGFRRVREIYQAWSSDSNAVADGIRRIGSRNEATVDGTSLFDSLWSTCYYEFRGQEEDAQNLILLFSDGVDTSSHATLEQTIGACQQSHTIVFVLGFSADRSDLSIGRDTLGKLTEQTGGGVTLSNGSEAEMRHALDSLAEEIRSEYQLFYRPKNLKRDGSFHRIVLTGPPRVATIIGQSGYYALPK
jgi:Ca-activated chloride channel family protein